MLNRVAVNAVTIAMWMFLGAAISRATDYIDAGQYDAALICYIPFAIAAAILGLNKWATPHATVKGS